MGSEQTCPIKNRTGEIPASETIGDVVYVYDKTSEEAPRTLRHEVIERFLVDRNEFDYVTIINNPLEAFNVVHRRQREELVERLARIV